MMNFAKIIIWRFQILVNPQIQTKKCIRFVFYPPPRSIKMKRLWHEYSLIEKEYSVPIDFHLAELDESKYEAKMYEKGSLRLGLSEKETNIDSMKEQERFSKFSLTAEISRYMNISCLTIAKILRESVDGSDNIVAAVNRHNEILEDVIIPEIFHTLYEVKSTQKSEDVDMVLLREPKDSGYYEFSANDELVITKGHNNFTPKEEARVSMQIHIVSTLNQRKNVFYSIFQVIRLGKFILLVCLLLIKVICRCNIMTLSQSD